LSHSHLNILGWITMSHSLPIASSYGTCNVSNDFLGIICILQLFVPWDIWRWHHAFPSSISAIPFAFIWLPSSFFSSISSYSSSSPMTIFLFESLICVRDSWWSWNIFLSDWQIETWIWNLFVRLTKLKHGW
jgi:hypothetical protein